MQCKTTVDSDLIYVTPLGKSAVIKLTHLPLSKRASARNCNKR